MYMYRFSAAQLYGTRVLHEYFDLSLISAKGKRHDDSVYPLLISSVARHRDIGCFS